MNRLSFFGRTSLLRPKTIRLLSDFLIEYSEPKRVIISHGASQGKGEAASDEFTTALTIEPVKNFVYGRNYLDIDILRFRKTVTRNEILTQNIFVSEKWNILAKVCLKADQTALHYTHHFTLSYYNVQLNYTVLVLSPLKRA